LGEPVEETVVSDGDEEEYEKPELELDERELLREWEEEAEIEESVENGEEERIVRIVSLSKLGATQAEGLVCSAIMAKICSSSSYSLSMSC
jgi:hypothetical protein